MKTRTEVVDKIRSTTRVADGQGDWDELFTLEDEECVALIEDREYEIHKMYDPVIDMLRELATRRYAERDCYNAGIYLELFDADSRLIENAKELLSAIDACRHPSTKQP